MKLHQPKNPPKPLKEGEKKTFWLRRACMVYISPATPEVTCVGVQIQILGRKLVEMYSNN